MLRELHAQKKCDHCGSGHDDYDARKGTEMDPSETEFKREPRYIVLKIKDALAHLSACQLDRLQEIGEAIAAGRAADGKPPFNAVVVEQDWPEFELTWAAIEARMTPVPCLHQNIDLHAVSATSDKHTCRDCGKVWYDMD